MRVVFLHIPKTAGQSVHAALESAFEPAAICPARVNDQLRLLSIAELNRYQVFSGHFDWCLLDCLKGPSYRFTILRDPMERILSFYFFLRKQGEALSPAERAKPQHTGMRAAAEMTPDEYFLAGPPHLRNFLNDHYDNFYTYYFAGRTYRGRTGLVGLQNRGVFSREKLMDVARANLAELDRVFTVDEMPAVFETIGQLAMPGRSLPRSEFRNNVNDSLPVQSRVQRLRELGASEETMKCIASWCEMDNELYAHYSARHKQPGAA
ncbi:sulfotransferase family 2 domain-containing protein [Ideonella sp. 4Y11]|uniref:Sulfotransferase family 2 domain-containing protein n=1 Tax=Ideonella aquatica TaxID=2824119 RepID=A0A940YLA4_9BURK|nr:sulfotransferase family 2 domain-containing protein [Ideonella aquatica]MBQ0959944.1 sulfotransferase family 2 domain-containing protein [Ideonella aquatica]